MSSYALATDAGNLDPSITPVGKCVQTMPLAGKAVRAMPCIALKEQLSHEHHRPVPAVMAAHTLRISTGGHHKYSAAASTDRCRLACLLPVPPHILSVHYYARDDRHLAVEGNRRWLTLRTLLI